MDKYCVPIRPEFHERLFPEADQKLKKQFSFDFDNLPQTPGNAIRKVYICHAQKKAMAPGSLLLFYRSADSVITSVGVLEEYREADSNEALLKIAGRRSVYTSDELLEKTQGGRSAKVVNFYYAENFSSPIPLKALKSSGVLKGSPQSIMSIDENSFNSLYSKLLKEKDKEIFYN